MYVFVLACFFCSQLFAVKSFTQSCNFILIIRFWTRRYLWLHNPQNNGTLIPFGKSVLKVKKKKSLKNAYGSIQMLIEFSARIVQDIY